MAGKKEKVKEREERSALTLEVKARQPPLQRRREEKRRKIKTKGLRVLLDSEKGG